LRYNRYGDLVQILIMKIKLDLNEIIDEIKDYLDDGLYANELKKKLELIREYILNLEYERELNITLAEEELNNKNYETL